MKKLLSVFLLMLAAASVASAEVDLIGMSYDELIDLSNQVGQAIMTHEDFDSVTVPLGVWEVGVDIPEGTWVVSFEGASFASVTYGPTLEKEGNAMPDHTDGNTNQHLWDGESWRINAKPGNYFEIGYNSVVFTSDTGSSGLGFKKK